MDDAPEITQWLDAARDGDKSALDKVLSVLYRELRQMARRQLGANQGGTLNPTALVHEAWLRINGRSEAQFEDRAHFFAYAASAMRSVVVDHARQRLTQKRGGELQRVTDLPVDLAGSVPMDDELLALDEALTRLAEVDARLAQVVELRYFAGLSEIEVASVQSRSERSVRRDWQKARMFLLASLDVS